MACGAPAAMCWCGSWVWPVPLWQPVAAQGGLAYRPSTVDAATQTMTTCTVGTQTECGNDEVGKEAPQRSHDVVSHSSVKHGVQQVGRNLRRQRCHLEKVTSNAVACADGSLPAQGVAAHAGTASAGAAKFEGQGQHVECGQFPGLDVGAKLSCASSKGDTLFKALQGIDPHISKEEYWDDKEWDIDALTEELELQEKSIQFGIPAHILRRMTQQQCKDGDERDDQVYNLQSGLADLGL